MRWFQDWVWCTWKEWKLCIKLIFEMPLQMVDNQSWHLPKNEVMHFRNERFFIIWRVLAENDIKWMTDVSRNVVMWSSAYYPMSLFGTCCTQNSCSLVLACNFLFLEFSSIEIEKIHIHTYVLFTSFRCFLFYLSVKAVKLTFPRTLWTVYAFICLPHKPHDTRETSTANKSFFFEDALYLIFCCLFDLLFVGSGVACASSANLRWGILDADQLSIIVEVTAAL